MSPSEKFLLFLDVYTFQEPQINNVLPWQSLCYTKYVSLLSFPFRNQLVLMHQLFSTFPLVTFPEGTTKVILSELQVEVSDFHYCVL